MKVTESVYSYDLQREDGEALSVHVVETEASTVLFGTGNDGTGDELADVISSHGIDIVIVEHGHIDHFGGVPRVRELTDARVAVPAGDAAALEDEDISPDVLLEADETYDGIRTISTPGHTEDNMAFLYGDVLIAGDTVVGSDSAFAADGDWSGAFAVLTSGWNADEDQMRESVTTLLEFDFDTVLVTHGANVETRGHQEIQTLVEDLDLA